MREDSGAYVRPRGRAWGNDAQRAVLHAIAEDIATREKMLGEASPLALEHIRTLGHEMGGWRHIPGERLDEETRAFLDEFGHRPDVPASGLPNGRDPDDQLVRMLLNEDGELRGMLYLDEPLSGLRPTADDVAAINAGAGVLFEAVISIVERELYGEQVRMVTQARRAIESVRPGLGEEELLAALSEAMVDAMDVATVDVLSEATVIAELEADRGEVTDLMRRQWLRRGHVVVERQRTWSMQEDSIETPPSLTRLLDTHGLGSGLLVPIGAGDDYLGTLAMDRAARRIADMIEDLMALATVSDPERSTSPVPVDLSAMVTESCQFLAPTAALGGLELRTDITEGLVVEGELAGLQRLVTNLLSNALKYTPAGGRVDVRLAPDVVGGRDGVRLTCADTGIGIAEAELGDVFTPFFRSSRPEARRRPGTGLGLAITERVVTGHHGTVEVESVLGEGTTFAVWLPAEADPRER